MSIVVAIKTHHCVALLFLSLCTPQGGGGGGNPRTPDGLNRKLRPFAGMLFAEDRAVLLKSIKKFISLSKYF
jgi:hypothetical protein